MNASVGLERRSKIDGPRAAGVVAFTLFLTNLGTATEGYVGVDFFFVVGGCLTSAIFLRELDQKRFTFIDLYERRIFSGLFVILIATAVARSSDPPARLAVSGRGH